MKIGLVCSDPFYFPGGIQEQVKGLYKFLKSEGHDVKILLPKYKSTENYGNDVIFTGMALSVDVFGSKANFSIIYGDEEIDEILRKEKFDILHLHGVGILITLALLKKSFSKNILTFHILPEKSLSFSLVKSLQFIYKEIFDRIDKITIPSKPVLKYMPKKYVKKISIVPNGIDLEMFKIKNSKIRKFLDGKINILFVGRLDKRKGLKYLIRAYEQVKIKYKNIRLIVVGEGYSREYYRKLVDKRHIADVAFEGYVKDKDLANYYATCDIFCSPSVQGESFGVTLLEAMASNKPIIASKITGYKDVFKISNAILFVKPKSVQGLARGISKLIENKKLRRRLGINGLKEVKKYSWKNVGKQFLKIYEDALDSHKSPLELS